MASLQSIASSLVGLAVRGAGPAHPFWAAVAAGIRRPTGPRVGRARLDQAGAEGQAGQVGAAAAAGLVRIRSRCEPVVQTLMCSSAACSEVLAAHTVFTRDTEGGFILGRSVPRPRDYRRTAVSGSGQRGLVCKLVRRPSFRLLRRGADSGGDDVSGVRVQPPRRPRPGTPVRSPMTRSIARAVSGASGMMTTLPPLRVIVRVRRPRSRSRCSMSAPVASETRSPFSPFSASSACSVGGLSPAATSSAPSSLRPSAAA